MNAIEQVITEIEALIYGLTRKEGYGSTAFTFLVFSMLLYRITKLLNIIQKRLILKVLASTGMSKCSTRGSLALSTPLGNDEYLPHRNHSWNYASVVRMIIYLESNAHTKIQFAVHQCPRLTYFPRASHEKAVNHICRYLQILQDKGLTLKMSDDIQLDCYVDAYFSVLSN